MTLRPAYDEIVLEHGGNVVILRPSLTEVRALFSYDPATGIFRRRVATNNRMKVGEIAGTLDRKSGYVRIRIRNKCYFAHRLAWLYVTGAWPEHEIDHRDRDRANNRWTNLRQATRAQNSANKLAKTSTGFKGVKIANGRFRASMTVAGKRIELGRFDTAEAAHAAYMNAANDAFGEYARAS